jgi:hypothetical protein
MALGALGRVDLASGSDLVGLGRASVAAVAVVSASTAAAEE